MGDGDTTRRTDTHKRHLNGSTAAWVAIGVTMALTLLNGVYVGGSLTAQVTRNKEDLQNLPTIIVPRLEVEAKLEGLENQVEAVDEKVEELKVQSAKETEQIIRRIERLDSSNRVYP